MRNLRKVYKANYYLIKDIKLALNDPLMKVVVDEDKIQDFRTNCIKEICKDLRYLIEDVKKTGYLDPVVYKELFNIVKSVYDDCYIIVDTDYEFAKSIININQQRLNDPENNNIDYTKQLININIVLKDHYLKFKNRRLGYLDTINEFVSLEDSALYMKDTQSKVIDCIIDSFPDIIKSLNAIEKMIKVRYNYTAALYPIRLIKKEY